MAPPFLIPSGVVTVNDLPFKTLLYRYFFFGWLFKDVNSADKFERMVAMQHNRRQASWLPVYMLRWAWWGLLFYGLGGGVELLFEAETLARCFYALSALCLSFTVTIATAWVGLTQRRDTA